MASRLHGMLPTDPPIAFGVLNEPRINSLSEYAPDAPAQAALLAKDLARARLHRAVLQAPETRAEVLARYPQLREELEAAEAVALDLLEWAKLHEPATLSTAGRQALDWVISRARISRRPQVA